MSVRSKILGPAMMAQYDLKWKQLALFYRINESFFIFDLKLGDQVTMLLDTKALQAIKRLVGPFGCLFCNHGKHRNVPPWVILDDNGVLAGVKPYKENDAIDSTNNKE